MSKLQKVVVALLATTSIGVWGVAIFFFTTSENIVPVENHLLHLTQKVDKEPIMYKNKQDIVVKSREKVKLHDFKAKYNENRVSIDDLLAAITKEEQ